MAFDPQAAPSYSFSLGYLVRWLVGVAVLGRQRRLGPDVREMLRGIEPLPRVEGIEHVPREGPCIVVMNHIRAAGPARLVVARRWSARRSRPAVAAIRRCTG